MGSSFIVVRLSVTRPVSIRLLGNVPNYVALRMTTKLLIFLTSYLLTF